MLWKEEVVDYFQNCTHYLRKTAKFLSRDIILRAKIEPGTVRKHIRNTNLYAVTFVHRCLRESNTDGI
jgi:hypothetical protein